MKEWKWGGIVSFSLVSLIYGYLIYEISYSGSISMLFNLLKTYPVMLLIFIPIGIVSGLIIEALRFFFGNNKKPKRRKKGQIWVSTVLYMALGLIAISVILSAGIPMINRMKERNTIIESKEISPLR